MASLRSSLLAAVGLALAVAPAAAEGPGPWKDVRARIREELRDLASCVEARGRAEGPSLTDRVNALLAYPREDLAVVLRDLLAAEEGEEDRGSSFGTPLRRTAAFLLGVAPTAERQFNGTQLVERQGFAVAAWVGMSGWGSPGPEPPPPPEIAVTAESAFRRPLRPRPFDLLKEILRDSDLAGDRYGESKDEFEVSAGRELGDCARKDAEFAKFLLSVALEPSHGRAADTVITAALGRWAGPGVVNLLMDRYRRALKEKEDRDFYGLTAEIAAALNEAGAGAAVRAIVKEEEASLDGERKGWLSRQFRGDDHAAELLEKVSKGPDARALGELAVALNDAMEARESLGLRLRAFDEALRIREASKDPDVRGRAFALLQTSLWPGMYWRFGYMQGKNFPQDADREAPLPDGTKPEDERDHFLGAWPDPEAQGRALKADLEAGRIRWDPKRPKADRGDPDRKEIEIWCDRAPEGDPEVDLAGRHEPGKVVLTVKNRRKTPIAVNPVAATYGVAMMVPLKGDPPGRVELDLQPGRILEGYRLLVPASAYKVIGPGETHEVAFACGKVAPGSRILLSLRDDFWVDGRLEVPVLARIWELTIPVR